MIVLKYTHFFGSPYILDGFCFLVSLHFCCCCGDADSGDGGGGCGGGGGNDVGVGCLRGEQLNWLIFTLL